MGLLTVEFEMLEGQGPVYNGWTLPGSRVTARRCDRQSLLLLEEFLTRLV